MGKATQIQGEGPSSVKAVSVADRLHSALEGVTGAPVTRFEVGRLTKGGPPLDALLTCLMNDTSVNFAVKILRQAYPRDVREAVWRLDEYQLTANSHENLILLVAADSLSPGARDLLRKRGIGYFESNGNLYLRWRQWLVDIERPNAEPAARKESRNLFSDAREMVVHALLEHRDELLTGSELARIAQTSTYTCSVVLQELERREWCESVGVGSARRRRLTQPRLLLDAWAEQWAKRNEHRSRYHVFSVQPNALFALLTNRFDKAQIAMPWAFTGTAAANAFAPLLTSVEAAEIVVPPGWAEWFAEALQLKPVDQGANVTLVERDGASLLFRAGIPGTSAYVASPFILYLDLLDGRGRNKELARHVLEQLQL